MSSQVTPAQTTLHVYEIKEASTPHEFHLNIGDFIVTFYSSQDALVTAIVMSSKLRTLTVLTFQAKIFGYNQFRPKQETREGVYPTSFNDFRPLPKDLMSCAQAH